jgi:hypothetical protein
MIAFVSFVVGLLVCWPIAFCHGLDVERRRR